MKKTIALALLCLGAAATASAASYHYSTVATGNDNSTLHGFTFKLSTDDLTASAGSDSPATNTLTGTYVMDSITVKGSTSQGGANVTYGLVVVDASNTVLGISDVKTSASNRSLTFTLSAAGGGSLTLDAATSYRFLTVSEDVINYVTQAGMTYAAGGTTATAATLSGTTISKGLKAPGMRVNSGAAASDDFRLISGSNGTSTMNYFVVIDDISISPVTAAVPEPATATLSLLALAGLAARRRRK